MVETLPVCPAPDPQPVAPHFAVPPGACDCHAHIFADFARYPLQANRGYTPAETPLPALFDLHDALGVERLVLVQASAHGTDSRVVLDAAAQHPERIRAVVAVAEGITDRELEDMHRRGARGRAIASLNQALAAFSSSSAASSSRSFSIASVKLAANRPVGSAISITPMMAIAPARNLPRGVIGKASP